ncbi:oxidoreductase [Aeromicrobium sp. A1-2]|uniref:ferredoxin--NADP reductase n=1 Tax=Aeromicrobium sp. A1-2 TaxID=2107713 RepID=UPI000E5288D6|nr:FAD-dependent oxidoreductase [Aeromicrobium sp. A1-2]AXT83778.1 oxidoreductase [Aeromicrobium sp. A1-2]
MRDVLDRQLGRITMYRLVTILLMLLAVVALAHTAAGTFTGTFTVRNELVMLAVLLVASYASNRLLGLVFRIRPHGESAIITALLLFFIFPPETEVGRLAWVAAAAVLGNASKYVLAWRGRHVFNPAAAGAFLVFLIPEISDPDSPHRIFAGWWIASESLLPFVAFGAVLILWRTRRLDLGLVFVAVAVALGVVARMNFHNPAVQDLTFQDAWTAALNTSAIVFLAGFMLSEPLTLPPRRAQQLVVAAVTAVAFTYPLLQFTVRDTPIDLGYFQVNEASALLIGNLVAFALARRHGLTFHLVGARQLTPETHELTFRPKRRITFHPGQYVELTVPHSGADGRGIRRSFSISSPPGPDGRVSFALRVPERSSTFKRALLALKPGDKVHATGVGGDFLLPTNPAEPVLLVAGGIGITPFLSQLRHEPARDAVLVYGVSSPEEVPFAEELSGARVVLVGPAAPSNLPGGWTYVEAPFLSVDLIAAAVPDLIGRRAYVSGPPAMVNAVRRGLAKRCRSLRTDYFTGY